MIVLLPFIVFVFWIGIYPKTYLNKMHTSVKHYVEQHQPEILKQELSKAPQTEEIIEEIHEEVHEEVH